jgi:hypothetical protein
MNITLGAQVYMLCDDLQPFQPFGKLQAKGIDAKRAPIGTVACFQKQEIG